MAAAAVRMIWKCTKPRHKGEKLLCESLARKAAEEYGMNTAVIR